METWLFVELLDAKAIIADKNGELWLPMSESSQLSERTETVAVAGVYFDVIGYNGPREALLLEPIVIDGAADHIEEEMIEYLSDQ